jgi:hypothetical protein
MSTPAIVPATSASATRTVRLNRDGSLPGALFFTAVYDNNLVGLIVIGEPTLEKGFDKAVTRAAKVVKQTANATADEIAEQMKEAAKS